MDGCGVLKTGPNKENEIEKDYLGLRFVLLVIACFLIGLGAKMAGSSTLGADVVVLVWEGLNRTFGVDMGTSNIIVSLVFLAITLSINWRYIGFGTVVGMFLQSFFIELFDFRALAEMDITIKVVAMVVGIALIAIWMCSVCFSRTWSWTVYCRNTCLT